MVQAPTSIPAASNVNIFSLAVHSLLFLLLNCLYTYIFKYAGNANISISLEFLVHEEEACGSSDRASMSRPGHKHAYNQFKNPSM